MKTFLLISIFLVASSLAKANSGESSQVEVRAVFINCEPDDREVIATDNEATRFEREELFKHSVLQDCNKKIALTVKIVSEPNQNSGDEYIPIEHVFRGPNKRVRLLDPYVLRLQRETPLQAYKLRRMATVNGVLSDKNEKVVRDSKEDLKSRSRTKRSESLSGLPKTRENNVDCGLTGKCTNNNSVCMNKRDKRNEHNIVVEEAIHEDKYPRWIAKNNFIQQLDTSRSNNFIETPQNSPNNKIGGHRNVNGQKNIFGFKSDERDRPSSLRDSDSWSSYPNKDATRTENTETNLIDLKSDWSTEKRRSEEYDLQRHTKDKKYAGAEKEFDLYEIGNPELLSAVQVQLFEKLTTPEGKTVWNDMSKGEPASVSSLSPEWSGQDMNIRYRPTEWVPREAFTLPLISLCLLTPLPSSNYKTSDTENDRSDLEKYIVVPKEDIMGLQNEDGNLQKRDGNYSNLQDSTEQYKQCQHHVLIRTSRAIFGGKEENLNIAVNRGEQFLTLPHRRPHHAQIDLEVRADENQLVPIGSSGRIMTVVADSSRRTRTTLTIQVTNTGLAAARFRAIARDCGPELIGVQNDNIGETFSDSPILLPPRHTRTIRVDVPAEIPADVAHCFVSLVNEEDETVAVREITIKKGDRCFCVWHCECVCLSEDPKLLCREMAEGRQMAAGLSPRERVRHARSICYHDVVSVNMLVTAFGVLITLLFFGVVKGCLGLVFRCIGSWGLHRLVQMPRKLDQYHESSLQNCSVVYDNEGWPVHPHSKERTVRLVSKSMEFILNLIFFVTTPCIIVYDILRQIYNCCKKSDEASSWHPCNKDKSCFSSHDVQGKKKQVRGRRRRHQIRKWMTPAAEELSSNLWQEGLPVKTTMMRPLLCEELCRGEKMLVQRSCLDSEGDDTEYVLMQMQKSKESLARSRKKLNGSEN